MSTGYRPESHAERDQIVAAFTSYVTSASADPTLLALDSSLFAAARAAYVAARQAWQEAASAARLASDAADAADVDFDLNLRLLSAGVRDAQGKASPRTLADMMGGTLPGELSRLPYRVEVQKATDLLARLDVRTDLSLDADRVAAFRASVAALAVATDADEAANRAALSAGGALQTAVADFDRAYSKLSRAIRAIVDEDTAARILPRFVRQAAPAREPAAA